MSRTIIRLLWVAFVSGTWLSAQAPDYLLKVDVPFVFLDVVVQDTSGKVIDDLPQNAFDVYEDGTRQDIRYFSPVSTPYDILLLFDRSGSTQDKWSLMQRAVAGFIANLRTQDRIAIATFDSELQSQLRWTGDRKKARRNLVIGGFLSSMVLMIPILFIHNLAVVAILLSGAFFFSEFTVAPMWAIPTTMVESMRGAMIILMR